MHRSKTRMASAVLFLAALAVWAISDAAAKPKNNISGSYSCYCLMDTGTCDMIQEAGRVRCGRSGSNPCKSSCRLDTTTSGIKGGVMMKAK